MPDALTLRVGADILCVAVCITGAIFDVRSRRIPNFLTLPAIGLGLLASISSGGFGVVGAFMAVLMLGGLLALFAAAGGVGWGDVKLMAAVGALLGWPLVSWPIVLYALLYTALCGGLLALLVAIVRKRFIAALKAVAFLPRRDRDKHRTGLSIPYGVAICLGTLWAIAARYVPALLLG